jgi:hypothetical protein
LEVVMKPILILVAACTVFACGDAVGEFIQVASVPDAGAQGTPLECVDGWAVAEINPGVTELEHCTLQGEYEICWRLFMPWVRGTTQGRLACSDRFTRIVVY